MAHYLIRMQVSDDDTEFEFVEAESRVAAVESLDLVDDSDVTVAIWRLADAEPKMYQLRTETITKLVSL